MAWLSPVTASVVYLVSLILTSQQCFEGISKYLGDVYPVNKTIYEGENVTFSCILNLTVVPHNFTAPNVSWYFMGALVNDSFYRIVNEKQNDLVLSNVSLNSKGSYYCMLPNLKYVCSSNLKVGLIPQPPENIRIVSHHLQDVEITWKVKNPYIATRYSLHYKLFKGLIYICPNSNCFLSEGITAEYISCGCVINGSDFHYLGLIEAYFVANNSIASYSFSNSSFLFTPGNYVQPNPPQNLTVVPLSSSALNVSWSLTFRNKANIILFYEIKFFPADDPTFVQNKIINTTSYTLTGLYPFREYEIRVRAKSRVSTSYYSEFATVKGMTKEDVPQAVPFILPGMFISKLTDQGRSITIFWKDIDEKWYGSPFISYHILINSSQGIEIIQTNASSIKKIFNSDSYHITITPFNVHGHANNSSTIIIPAANKILDNVELNFFLHMKNPNRFNLTWFPLSPSLDKYVTVYWCEKKDISKSLNLCNYTHLSNNFSSWELISESKYQVGTSVESQLSSSGLKWWDECLNNESEAPNRLNVKFIINATAIEVLFQTECDQKSLFLSHLIKYCETSNCDETKKNYSISKMISKVNLEHLKPYTNYTLTFYSTRISGLQEIRITEHVQTLESRPDDPPRSVKINHVGLNDLFLTWLPPLHPNGNIVLYEICQNDEKSFFNTNSSFYNFTNLIGNTYYKFQVRACTTPDMCSSWSEVVDNRTEVRVPPQIENLKALTSKDNDDIRLTWNKPNDSFEGPIDMYLIYAEWIEDNSKSSRNFSVDGSRTSEVQKVNCSESEGKTYKFYISAVRQSLIGKQSEPTSISICPLARSDNLVGIVAGILAGGCGIVIFVLVFCCRNLWKKMRERFKIPEVTLPNGIMDVSDEDRFEISLKKSIRKKKNDYENLKPIPQTVTFDGKNLKGLFLDHYEHKTSTPSMTSSGIGSSDQNSISSQHSHLSSDSGAVVDGNKTDGEELLANSPTVQESNLPYIPKDDVIFTSQKSKKKNQIPFTRSFYKPESMPSITYVNKVTDYSQITLNPDYCETTYVFKYPENLSVSHKCHSYPKLGPPSQLLNKENILQAYVPLNTLKPSTAKLGEKTDCPLVHAKSPLNQSNTTMHVDPYVQIGVSKAEEFDVENIHFVNSYVLNTTMAGGPVIDVMQEGRNDKSTVKNSFIKNAEKKESETILDDDVCISDYSKVSLTTVNELNPMLKNERQNHAQFNDLIYEGSNVYEGKHPKEVNIKQSEVGFVPGLNSNGYVSLPT